MALPQMTNEQRAAALEKAATVRKERAQVKKDLKAGNITLTEVLDKKSDPVIGKMRATDLIKSLPGIGKAKSEKLMEQFGISETRRVAGLGQRQVEQLVEFYNSRK